MEASMIENMEKLYHRHLVTAFLYLCLIIVTVLVAVGVVKFKLLKTRAKNVALVFAVTICTVGLILLQIMAIAPVYKDYTERSYVVVENATMTVRDGSSGGIDSTNRVELSVDGNMIELKMYTDYSLDTGVAYTGKFAYLKHSGYLIWYELDSE